MPVRRQIAIAVAGALLITPRSSRAQVAELRAPNVVPISPTLATSGQPSATALAGLAAAGFQAVIYLAPNTVSDAVTEEPAILMRQGIEFIHIPIPFAAPEEKHYLAAAEALTRLSAKKVLVHCQVNLRASSIVFLYRSSPAESPRPLPTRL